MVTLCCLGPEAFMTATRSFEGTKRNALKLAGQFDEATRFMIGEYEWKIEIKLFRKLL